MDSLRVALTECARKIDGYEGRRTLNEANTKASLIEVVFRGLGWDTSDADEVDREYRHQSRHKPTDYALVLPDRQEPSAVVEAKSLGTDLTQPEIVSQALGYATDTGAACAVITDGNEWHVYYAHGNAPGKDRLYRAVRIADIGEEISRVLSLLSKDNLRSGTLQRLWLADRTDRQVDAALRRLFDPADRNHDRLCAMFSSLLPNVRTSAVEESLSRLQASFTFSLPALGPTVIPRQQPQPTPVTAQRQKSHPPITDTERSIGLADLLNAGRLQPGDLLHARYKGTEHVAKLLPDASLALFNTTYDSVSAAAVAVKHAVNGTNPEDRKMTDRGWPFWSGIDRSVGDHATLLEIRRRHAEQLDRASAGT